MVEELEIEEDVIRLTIVLPDGVPTERDSLRAAVRAALHQVAPGVATEIDLRSTPPPQQLRGRAGAEENLIPRVRQVVAVASGKGGVGKTTVSVNLALALSAAGKAVGLLDADIYGPNVPIMVGIHGQPELTSVGGKIQPPRRFGIKIMSIGFFLPAEGKPVIWRGPMIHSALQQFLRDVDWGELDYLVVDLPPGTGDASLSLAQLVPLTGVVIVTTPQDVALQDVTKSVGMFQQLDVPILGVVENMAYFLCPHCGKETRIFGEGGAERLAASIGAPLLASIPLDPAVRVGGDTGHPVAASSPASPQAQAFAALAARVMERTAAQQPPAFPWARP